MARQLGDLHERGIFPDEDLILTVSMGADEFVGVLGPSQIADLGSSVNALERLTGQGVPEADAAIGGAPAGSQETMLVRRPGDGLDCRGVLHKPEPWRQGGIVPDEELVVVSSRRQFSPIR